ncbi:MAG: hypothetical protein V1899_04745 [Planctomycetota bacterium]
MPPARSGEKIAQREIIGRITAANCATTLIMPDGARIPFTVRAIPVDAVVRVLGTEFIVELVHESKESLMQKGTPMQNRIIMTALVTVLSGTVGVTQTGAEEIIVPAGKTMTVTKKRLLSDVIITPRSYDAWEAFDKLEHQGRVRVIMLGERRSEQRCA